MTIQWETNLSTLELTVRAARSRLSTRWAMAAARTRAAKTRAAKILMTAARRKISD
jgi:hypothetical protein